MSIKLILLNTGETIISDIKELISDDEEDKKIRGYVLTNPKKVGYTSPMFLSEESEIGKSSVEVSLSSWILLSNDKEILIPFDSVLAIVEPVESVKKMYEGNVNGISD